MGAETAQRDPRIERHEVDLLDDRSVRESPAWDGATHVFHVGGVTKAGSLGRFCDGNVRPTANLLAAIASLASVPRFVLVSSQAAAGPAESADSPVREDHAPRPVEAYGQSKLEAERETMRHAARVPVVIVRPGAVYGPRDRGFLPAFREASSRIALHAAPRDQLFSVLHVRDVVDGLIRAAEHPDAAGRTYFLAAEQPTTWRAIYAAIALAAGAAPLEVQLPALLLRAAALGGDVLGAASGRSFLLNSHKIKLAGPRWWLCDSSRARHELAWRPQVVLHDGVPDTYYWYVREGWLRGPKATTAQPIEEPEA
jgi:nucleoside-diphosphate-sugar epimerase